MRVLNNVLDPNDTDLNEVRGALYDRFYDPPVGSYAEQFDWIGEQVDWSEDLPEVWSGVGKGNGPAQWSVMISPSFYLTAGHASGAGPFVLRHSNDADGPSESHSKQTGFGVQLGSDLHLGRFSSTISAQVAAYPVYTTEDREDLVDLELYVFGRSDAHSDFGGDGSLRIRLGRNVVSSLTSANIVRGSGQVIEVAENAHFRFTFDVSESDFAGPDGKGDGLVGDLEESVQDESFIQQLSSPNATFSYVDGDLVPNFDEVTQQFLFGVVGLDDIRLLSDEIGFLRGANLSGTGGLGWDEAWTRGGDSGGSSFTLVDNKPAVISIHSGSIAVTDPAVSQDAIAGIDPSLVIQEFEAASTTERPCFISFSRKFVIGADGFDLPLGLEENKRVFGDVNGDYRLTTDDILTLEQEIVNHRDHGPYPYNWGFDLDADGDIDVDDMTTLMEEGFKTSRSDISGVVVGAVSGPNGIVDVLGDALVQVGNLGMVDASFLDGDLNLDGEVNVLGDALILVAELGTNGMLRLEPDFNDDGVLNAADIDLLTPLLHPTAPAPYEARFDLTTSMLADDEVTVIPNPDAASVPDGVVDLADLVFYLEEVLGTVFGDINFDGELDTLGDRFQQQRLLGQETGWLAGDLNFDGEVNCLDAELLRAVVTGTTPDLSNCE